MMASSAYSSSIALLTLVLLVNSLPPGSAFLWGWGNKAKVAGDRQPNIVMVVADDVGYNDVGYHGSEIRTPNIDALAEEGVKLENYYVQPTCTPTRSTLLSGQYMIHTGLQHGVIRPCQPMGVPSRLPLLPELLVKAGYSTYGVGKWHLGHYSQHMLPTRRGFQRFFGFYTGSIDYFMHDRRFEGYWGLDMHDDERPARETVGTYSTHLFTQKAEDYIENHNASSPMFLYLAYQAAHSPQQVPPHYREQYDFIADRKRRLYASMVTCMDEGIGNVTRALKKRGLWDNTIFIFTTDNGGSRSDGGSNWPLRGGKGSMWEGGIRAVGFVHGARVPRGQTNKQMLHVADWLPTLVTAAGGSYEEAEPLDGFDQWRTISKGSLSPRKEFLVNINPLTPKHGNRHHDRLSFDTRVRAAIRMKNWKLITGNPGLDPEYPMDDDPYGEIFEVDEEEDIYSDVMPDVTWDLGLGTRMRFSGCVTAKDIQLAPSKNVWLFDLDRDPEETDDVSATHPDVVRMLLRRLSEHAQTAVTPQRPPSSELCDPHRFNGSWEPWE